MTGRLLVISSLFALSTAFFDGPFEGGTPPSPPGIRPFRPPPFRRIFHLHGGLRRGGPPPFLPPPPPFLINAPEEARKEFMSIVGDSNLTKAEIKDQIHEWSSKQSPSLQAQVKDFEANLTRAKDDIRMNVTSVLLQLQTAVDRFSSIINDDSLTHSETGDKLKGAASAFDRDIVFAARMIMHNARMRVIPVVFSLPPPPAPMPFPFPPPPPPPFDPFFPPPPEGDEDPFGIHF